MPSEGFLGYHGILCVELSIDLSIERLHADGIVPGERLIVAMAKRDRTNAKQRTSMPRGYSKLFGVPVRSQLVVSNNRESASQRSRA